MQTKISQSSVSVWLSAKETYDWANKPGAAWPCSQLSGKRIFAQYDSNGLLDLAINGKMQDCDAGELNAIIADHVQAKLPKEHPLYFIICGQFISDLN